MLYFVPCTEIMLPDGSKKRVDQVQLGDMVMSFNEDDDLYEIKTVNRVAKCITEELIRITTDMGKITCFENDLDDERTLGVFVGDEIDGYTSEFVKHTRVVEKVEHLTAVEVENYNDKVQDDICIVFNIGVTDNCVCIANNNHVFVD